MEYNYKKLSDLQTRINRLNHLKEVAFWDQATNMSEKGLNARSEAIAELSQIVHELECDPNNKKIIFDAENEDLSETERANLVEIKRKFESQIRSAPNVSNVCIGKKNPPGPVWGHTRQFFHGPENIF